MRQGCPLSFPLEENQEKKFIAEALDSVTLVSFPCKLLSMELNVHQQKQRV